jgi:hypothetical protein
MADTPLVRAETWFKQHERLIIVALVLVFCAFGVSKYFDVSAVRADAKFVAAQQIAVNDRANAAAAAQQAAITVLQYQAMVDALSKQNASLSASIAQRTASGNTQRTVDAKMALSPLVSRWNEVAGTEIDLSLKDNTVTVSDTDAHKTVDLLEQVPVLAQNLKDETVIAGNLQNELNAGVKARDAKDVQISALNKELTDDAKACTLQIAAVKADARKSKGRWAKISFVIGFLARQIIKTETGL